MTLIRTIDGNAIEVAEPYDVALEKFWPLQQASSALEARASAEYTTPEGARIMVNPSRVLGIEEQLEAGS